MLGKEVFFDEEKNKLWNLWKVIRWTVWILSTTFLLWWQPANDDSLSSQNLENLNKLLVHNNISYTAKEVVNYNLGLLRKYLQIEDNKKLEQINTDIIKLFTGAYNDKINWEKVLFKFWELKDKYNLKDEQLLKLFEYYLNNNLISKKSKDSIKNILNITYTWLLSRYNRQELSKKLNEADKLYKNGKLDRETIKNIFPEYWKKIDKNWKIPEIYILLMFLVVWWAFWIGVYSDFRENELQEN